MATPNNVTPIRPARPMTPAERQRLCRARKAAAKGASPVVNALPAHDVARQVDIEPRAAVRAPKVLRDPAPGAALQTGVVAVGAPIVPQTVDLDLGELPHVVTVAPVTPAVTSRVTLSRRPASSIVLSGAAFALAAVGITMNGWFARSLGSTDVAGWLFLAVGVAADCAALAIPSCTARLWNAHQRASALIGWLVWSATFAFALSASIGFASLNISDVTASRASRVTPAVTTAQAQLADAVTARDRECKTGTGKFCREREAAVVTAQGLLNTALTSVAQAADPQTESAIRVVTFLTAGSVRPSADDFALVRLLLLAFLPQIGGILLMLARE